MSCFLSLMANINYSTGADDLTFFWTLFECDSAVSSMQKNFRAQDAVKWSNAFASGKNNPVVC